MQQGCMVGESFLIAGIQFAKAVKPRMTGFHDPSPRPKTRSLLLCAHVLTARPDMGRVVAIQHGLTGRFTGVGVVGTKVLRLFLGHFGPLDHQGIQDRFQLTHIMTIGPGYDEGKRDAMLFHEQLMPVVGGGQAEKR